MGNSSVRRAWFFLNGDFAMETSFEYYLMNYFLTLAYSSRIWQVLALGIGCFCTDPGPNCHDFGPPVRLSCSVHIFTSYISKLNQVLDFIMLCSLALFERKVTM